MFLKLVTQSRLILKPREVEQGDIAVVIGKCCLTGNHKVSCNLPEPAECYRSGFAATFRIEKDRVFAVVLHFLIGGSQERGVLCIHAIEQAIGEAGKGAPVMVASGGRLRTLVGSIDAHGMGQRASNFRDAAGKQNLIHVAQVIQCAAVVRVIANLCVGARQGLIPAIFSGST